MNNKKSLQMGWIIPTIGDTPAFSDPSKRISQSREHFERVAVAAEQAGFDYVQVPLSPFCWDAWVTASFVIARTQHIKTLVSVKPGFIHPVIQARMFATFDQLSKGRIYINLIAGLSEKHAYADGQISAKGGHYEQLEEAVELMKHLWTEERVEYQGKYSQTHPPKTIPSPFQQPHPPFFLGGASELATEISAKHASVHLFWGDYPERIAEQIKAMRERAAKYGRGEEIKFAMRLQIICRKTEAQAWAAAGAVVGGVGSAWTEQDKTMMAESVANPWHTECSKTAERNMAAHLWAGSTATRPCAGMAVVGNPRQVAEQLLAFVDAGCSGFCLSGYPHHEEAERFGRLVMPLLKG